MTAYQEQNTRLLAIDDSVLIHRLLKAHLRHEHLELHCATTGADGIQMANALNPDAILLDVKMDDMDGFEVLSELKSDANTQRIPVIMLSGNCTTEDRVRGLDLGAVDFISKPFEIAELKARVRSAIRITRLVNMLAQRARIDGMTGLWNRAYLDERLAQEVAQANRYETNLALILCDIDLFKNVNDTYGHPVGDLILEQFARILSDNRLTDIACRYGGEEFAMIVPHCDAQHAAFAAERVRFLIEEYEWQGQENLKVTVSFGVSDIQLVKTKSALGLLESADKALYEAKQTGRNRVCIARDDGISEQKKTA